MTLFESMLCHFISLVLLHGCFLFFGQRAEGERVVMSFPWQRSFDIIVGWDSIKDAPFLCFFSVVLLVFVFLADSGTLTPPSTPEVGSPSFFGTCMLPPAHRRRLPSLADEEETDEEGAEENDS